MNPDEWHVVIQKSGRTTWWIKISHGWGEYGGFFVFGTRRRAERIGRRRQRRRKASYDRSQAKYELILPADDR